MDMMLYLCVCNCGRRTIVPYGDFAYRSNISCGCNKKRPRTGNKYDISGSFGIGFFNNSGNTFIFDLEDYDAINQYTWYEKICEDISYAVSSSYKIGRMHRLILKTTDSEVVDHMDGNGLNNRKENLRICKQSENSRNCKTGKNNTTGHKGITNRGCSWYASITYNYKQIGLGHYKNIEDAIAARKDAEIKYFGSFATER